MKVSGIKSLFIAVMAIISAFGIFSGSAFGQTTASKNISGLKQDKMAINRDLTNISLQQEKINMLEKQCKDERVSGAKNTSTRCDLMKAKADLNKDKGYLRVDKSDFLKQYQAVIDNHRMILKDERAQLWQSRKKLDNDLDKGNSRAVLYAQDVVNRKQTLKMDKAALRNAISGRNDDLLAINKDIRNVNGQPAMVLDMQNTTAKAQNLAMK